MLTVNPNFGNSCHAHIPSPIPNPKIKSFTPTTSSRRQKLLDFLFQGLLPDSACLFGTESGPPAICPSAESEHLPASPAISLLVF